MGCTGLSGAYRAPVTSPTAERHAKPASEVSSGADVARGVTNGSFTHQGRDDWGRKASKKQQYELYERSRETNYHEHAVRVKVQVN